AAVGTRGRAAQAQPARRVLRRAGRAAAGARCPCRRRDDHGRHAARRDRRTQARRRGARGRLGVRAGALKAMDREAGGERTGTMRRRIRETEATTRIAAAAGWLSRSAWPAVRVVAAGEAIVFLGETRRSVVAADARIDP